jgi:hypothetical protein
MKKHGISGFPTGIPAENIPNKTIQLDHYTGLFISVSTADMAKQGGGCACTGE